MALGKVLWMGSWGGQQAAVLEEEGPECGCLTVVAQDGQTRYRTHGPGIPDGRRADGVPPYLGGSLEQIAASGRDLLGEAFLQKISEGTPLSLEAVRDVLPPLREDAFGFLSGAASWSGLTVTLDGAVYGQPALPGEPSPLLFSPAELDETAGALRPVMTLLEGALPLLICRYGPEPEGTTAVPVMTAMMFVESGDTGRDPLLWVRAHWAGDMPRETFARVSLSRRPVRMEITADLYWDAFLETARFWQQQGTRTAGLKLGEDVLALAVQACFHAQAATFSGAHPHYGHRHYGCEVHDYFPPTALTAMEARLLYGDVESARRIAGHMLEYAVGPSGRFIYRQGEGEVFGAAGTEYGQWLWLLNRYRRALGEAWLLRHRAKLCRMGDFLLSTLAESQELPGARLIRMCAEADTNGRVYDYVQNSLWAVRGLQALAELAGDQAAPRYREAADSLHADVKRAIAAGRVESRFGPVPPFQMQYRELPLTLSPCRDTAYPVDDDAYRAYLRESDARERFEGGQDYFENVYANYRYYLEMVSSGLLEPEEEQAIVSLRESLGGEILGMSRFLNRVDDWPAFHWARFLLESGRIEKYLLLLYAHAEHHGLRHLAAYYEQPGIDGKLYAPDCVPALLLTPLMVGWMLVFEPVRERAVYLLRGVPADWYEAGVAADGLSTGYGPVSLEARPEGSCIRITLALPEMPEGVPVYLEVRRFDRARVLEGEEAVAQVQGNRLRLAEGRREVALLVGEQPPVHE